MSKLVTMVRILLLVGLLSGGGLLGYLVVPVPQAEECRCPSPAPGLNCPKDAFESPSLTPPRQASPDSPRRSGEVGALKQHVAYLRLKAAAQLWMLYGYRDELEEPPVEWSIETIPDSYRPDAFLDVIDRLLAQAPEEVEVVDVRCDEYPCLALVRINSDDAVHWNYFYHELADLDAWREAYPKLHPHPVVKKVECDDGRSVFVMTVHNGWPGVFDDDEPAWPGYYGRYFARAKQLQDEAACLQP